MTASYTDVVLPVVRRTREMLLPHFGNITHENKSDDTPVTKLDLAIETYLRTELSIAYPAISFAGEEFGGSRDSDLFWLCDPIDGTGCFIHGLPFCTVMLSLVQDQKIVFAVIYDFVRDVAYHATRGKGAFANDQKIGVSNRPLAGSIVAWETRMTEQKNRDIFLRLYERASLVDTANAGWSFAMVAAGKLDGRITFDGWGFDYDFAPGSLLVEEAGGVVANIGKRSFDYRNRDFLAVNPTIFKELTQGPDAIFPVTA